MKIEVLGQVVAEETIRDIFQSDPIWIGTGGNRYPIESILQLLRQPPNFRMKRTGRNEAFIASGYRVNNVYRKILDRIRTYTASHPRVNLGPIPERNRGRSRVGAGS
jgi:hypothetical protein